MDDSSDPRHGDRDATVRRAWLDQVITETQRFAGDFSAADRDAARGLLQAFPGGLPPTAGRFERLMLRELLLDIAFKCGSALHNRLHTDTSSRCAFDPAALLNRFWQNDQEDAIGQFERWRAAFFDELTAAHPPSLASSVGRLVRREFQKPWQLANLARRFKTSPAQIRRTFVREFGLSVHEYQRLARLVAALSAIRDEKIAAVSRDVGYKSKKNFFHAFVWLTGVTPGVYRKLPQDSAAEVQLRASARLIRPGPEELARRSTSGTTRTARTDDRSE